MKRFCLLLGCFLFIASCSSLPKVNPRVSGIPPEDFSKCRMLFLQGRWQLQHSIEATLQGGRKSFLMGVSVISSKSGSIRSILMTIEGLVLFDAVYDGELQILRAVSPFDSEHFAQGLINDIRLLFFMPEGALSETGTLANGMTVCRYLQPDRLVVDIVRNSDHHWELHQYGRWFGKKRTVDIFLNDKLRFDGLQAPGRLKLTSHGYNGYTLDMELIEAVSLQEQQ